MISLIVAKSQNDIIGSSNQIPWHLPEDLKRFKKHAEQGHAMAKL